MDEELFDEVHFRTPDMDATRVYRVTPDGPVTRLTKHSYGVEVIVRSGNGARRVTLPWHCIHGVYQVIPNG